MMDQSPITCELADQRELDRRYLAGQLDEGEAAAFEEHFFGCDHCWNLVQAGTQVRAAFAAGASLPVARPRKWVRPLALAAGLGILLFGTWRLVVPPGAANPEASRGLRDSLAVHSELSAGDWRVVWPSDPAATSYRVRVFSRDGRVLLTRELEDTSLTLPADSLSALGEGAALFLEVQGFDLLRRPVAQSPLTPLRAPGASR